MNALCAWAVAVPLPGAGCGRACRVARQRLVLGLVLGLALGLALATAAWVPAGAAAEPASPYPLLSLDGALRIAQQRSQALIAREHAGEAAREMAIAAGRLPDPVLRLSLDNVPIEGSQRFSLGDDFMTMRSIALTQTVTRADTRRARRARFEREADAAHATGTLALTSLRRDTALAWFDRHFAQQLLDLLSAQREEAALQIVAAEAAYRAGRGTQTDVLQARSALAGMDERILAARARVTNARTMLARWVGEAAFAPLAAAPSIARTTLAPDALAQRIEEHPDLVLLAAREALARAEAEVARQARHADWSVSLMYSQRGAAFADMVSLGVSIPLPWDRGNRQDRELAAKLAQVNQVRAEREELSREHFAQTQRWVEIWRSNLARLQDYDRALIPLAAERTQAALAAYRGGGSTLGAVIESRRMEIATRIERLRIEMEAAASWSELEFLVPRAAPPAAAGGGGAMPSPASGPGEAR